MTPAACLEKSERAELELDEVELDELELACINQIAASFRGVDLAAANLEADSTEKKQAEKPPAKPKKKKTNKSRQKPWSENQELALQLVLSRMKIQEVANKVGVNRRTIYRWMKLPRFQAGLKERKELVQGSLREYLASLLPTAVETLQNAVCRDDLNTALSLLKSLQVLDGSPVTNNKDAYVASTPSPAATTSSAVAAQAASPSGEHDDRCRCGAETNPTASPAIKKEQPATASPVTEEVRHLRHAAEITPAQQRILEALEEGASMRILMQQSRSHILRLQYWIRTSAAFRAAIFQQRLQSQSHWELLLMWAGLDAAACVERALQRRNSRAALALLKGFGLLKE